MIHGKKASRRGGVGPVWRLGCWIAGSLLVLGAGCGSEATSEFEDLGLVPAQAELIEFSLGKYAVPIPIAGEDGDGHPTLRNGLQFDFELFAVITRDQRSRFKDAWARHEGKIRDRVIRVCRSATLDELEEHELATLKAHLMDAVQSQLGDKEVRQLSIAEVGSRRL
jgi:hypothetical protein